MNQDSYNQLGSAAVAAPVQAQINFIVVDYSNKGKNKENEVSYANNGTMQVQQSGIHMGIMADNNKSELITRSNKYIFNN